jgi:TonB family protein
VFLPLPDIHTEFVATPAEGDEIVDTLRGAIAAGASALDPILTAIAEAAQTLTGATAAVVALRTNGAVLCRARSGESAPDIGSPLSEKSGISGECLHTGKTLRCDDTQKDYRVNPEVCRRLGLRSIAVLPLRSRLEIAGVLEVFSDRAYAFGEAQMNSLSRLAELAEAAYTQDFSAQAKAQPEPEKKAAPLIAASEPWTHPNEIALRRLGTQVMTEELRGDGRGRLRVGIAAALLLVASAIGWRVSAKSRHEASVPSQAQAQIQPAASSADDSIPISLTNITSTSGRADRGSEAAITIVRRPRQAQDAESDSEVDDVVTRKLNAEPSTPAPEAAPADNGGALVSSALRETVPAPKLEAVAAPASGALGSLLASPTTVPKFKPLVSQGVTGGVLQRKVEPIYPRQAMALRLEGPVQLEATVNPEGKVSDVKIVKGQPILAEAAVDAVRQWRYSPYQLNGQPVAVQAQIVVNFNAPK